MSPYIVHAHPLIGPSIHKTLLRLPVHLSHNVQSTFSITRHCQFHGVCPKDFVLNHKTCDKVKNVENSYTSLQLSMLIKILNMYIYILVHISSNQ